MAHIKDVENCIELFVKFLEELTPELIDTINNKN
jgi:putative aminopeptidase FrvX